MTNTIQAKTGFEPILSALRINIFPRNGGERSFNLYRQSFVDGFFSPCKRIRVFPRKAIIDGEKITVADQFNVYLNGKRVPDHQYSIARAYKPAQAQPKQAGKQSNGKAHASIFSFPIVA